MTSASSALLRKQRGALIVALMAGIAIMLILSTVAVQAWADVARRDAEAEMMFRAQDITRALKRFQADRGTLPTDLKELLEVGQRRPQYFLRQMWKDPLVKDGKWGLIYANPAGGVIDPSVPGSGTPGGIPGLPGQPNQPGQPGQPGQPATGLNGNNGNMGSFPPIGKIGENNGTGTGAGEGTGLPIAGVKSKCTDRPFRKFRDKTSYSEWIFTIFDLEPRAAAQVSQPAPQQGQPGQPANFPPTPVTPNTGNPGGK